MNDDFEAGVIDAAVQLITPIQLGILIKMAKGTELVQEKGKAWIGYYQTSPRTVNALLRFCAISLEDGCILGKFERYTINGTGREILRRLGK